MVRSHRAALLRVTIAALLRLRWCAASCSRPTDGGGRETKRGGGDRRASLRWPGGGCRAWFAALIHCHDDDWPFFAGIDRNGYMLLPLKKRRCAIFIGLKSSNLFW
jgi:hypothetical protein